MPCTASWQRMTPCAGTYRLFPQSAPQDMFGTGARLGSRACQRIHTRWRRTAHGTRTCTWCLAGFAESNLLIGGTRVTDAQGRSAPSVSPRTHRPTPIPLWSTCSMTRTRTHLQSVTSVVRVKVAASDLAAPVIGLPGSHWPTAASLTDAAIREAVEARSWRRRRCRLALDSRDEPRALPPATFDYSPCTVATVH